MKKHLIGSLPEYESCLIHVLRGGGDPPPASRPPVLENIMCKFVNKVLHIARDRAVWILH